MAINDRRWAMVCNVACRTCRRHRQTIQCISKGRKPTFYKWPLSLKWTCERRGQRQWVFLVGPTMAPWFFVCGPAYECQAIGQLRIGRSIFTIPYPITRVIVWSASDKKTILLYTKKKETPGSMPPQAQLNVKQIVGLPSVAHCNIQSYIHISVEDGAQQRHSTHLFQYWRAWKKPLSFSNFSAYICMA